MLKNLVVYPETDVVKLNFMDIQPIVNDQFNEVIDLLNRNNLPTSDITRETKLFVMTDQNKIIGSIGLEIKKNMGLLRSLSVDDKYRNKGSAISLVNYLEDFARELHLDSIYLLTTTAEQFFTKRKYKVIDRNTIPDEIRDTSEFQSVCPASAVVMKKHL